MIDLDQNEKIVLKVRRHKFVLLTESIFLSVFVILPPVAYFLLNLSGFSIRVGGNFLYLFLFLYSAAILFSWIIFFKIWTDYYLDILVITDKRIIDIEQRGFFHRDVATLRLDKIQDIRINIRGVLATFLDLGEIHIQTAGESKEFVMYDIPEPNKIKSVIYDLHNELAEAPKPVRVVE